MGRTKVNVNKNELLSVINDLESKCTFSSLSDLYKAVEASEWARKHNPPLTSSVILLRINEYKIPTKTTKGKKFLASIDSKPIADKKLTSETKEWIAAIRGRMDKKFHKLILKAANGSKKARIKLKCLDCSGETISEIKNCKLMTCGIWLDRPYQTTNLTIDATYEEETEDANVGSTKE